jgi:hypothetical protein
MLSRAAVVLLLAPAALLASPASPAAAEFAASGSGSGLATSQSVAESAPPVPVVTGREVTVSWSMTTLTGGTPAASYTVRRYDSADVAQTVLAACDVVTTTSCVENNVPIGTWTYSVQAGLGSWVGPEGPKSAPVTVATSSFVLDSTAPIVALPAALTGTIANYLVGETLTYRLDSTTGPVLAGSPSTVTSSTSMAVSVTVPAGTSDAPHSVFVVGSGGSFASAAINIVFPPLLQSMQMRDVNGSGKVDQVTVVFNETLAAYTAGIAPWTLANVPSAGSLASVIVAGNTATLTIAEGPGAANTALGSFTVALSANSAGVRDVNGHQSSFAATAPTDVAAPAVVALNMLDNDIDGKVDRVTATFSEALLAYTAGTAPWTLANVPSGGTLASVSPASPTLTLNLNEGGAAANTAVGAMTVAMAANGGGARDAAGNLSSFTARTPLDAAKPMPLTITDTNGSINGRAQPGDTIVITYTEPLAPASVPASTTVTLTDPLGGGNDTLTMVGVSNGAGTLGSNRYVTNNNTVASFTNSTVTRSNGDRTITVTISATCSTPCAALRTQGSLATYTYAPATTLADVAGNLIVTTAFTTSIRLF